MGKPELYAEDGVRGRRQTIRSYRYRIGIREVTSEPNAATAPGLFYQRKEENLLIRGGGRSPDLMLRENSQRLADEFRYVRDMGLTMDSPRRQRRPQSLADREGVLVMAGWCRCDHALGQVEADIFDIAKASLTDQILGCEPPQRGDVAQRQRQSTATGCRRNVSRHREATSLPEYQPSSATGKPATVSGDSGVKMSGPYEYVAPSYWTEDKIDGGHHCNPGGCGGAYGFNTETSPGPGSWPIELAHHVRQRSSFGRSTTGGISTRAAASSRISTFTQRHSPTATASPTRWRTTFSKRRR